MAPLDTTCPICAAPHAKKLALIYSEGLSNASGQFEATSTFQTIGRQKIQTEGRSDTVQQTVASKEAAPPPLPKFVSKGEKKKHDALMAGIVGVGLLGIAVAASGASGTASLLTVGVAVGIGVMISAGTDTQALAVELEEHRRQYPNEYAAYDRWEKTFKCQSCGHRFVPQAESGTQVAV